MLDPVSIRFSQGSIGEHFKDEPEVSIFETFEKIRDGMQKREVPMMHVVRRQDGSDFGQPEAGSLQDGKTCWQVWNSESEASSIGGSQTRASPQIGSKVEGLSVTVRGTNKIVGADGSVTTQPALSDGQLQHRADTGGHWSSEQLSAISRGIVDFEAVVKGVLGNSAKLMKAGSFMKGTDVKLVSQI